MPNKVERPEPESPTASVNNPWMTVDQLAVYLNVKPGTVKQWAKTGKIPYGKAGSGLRFHRDDVDAWVRSNGRRRVAKRAAV